MIIESLIPLSIVPWRAPFSKDLENVFNRFSSFSVEEMFLYSLLFDTRMINVNLLCFTNDFVYS